MVSNLYPVPVKDMLSFNIDAQDKSSVEVIIKDVVGKVVYSDVKNVTPGSNKVSVSMKKQTAGVYFITLKAGSTSSTEKFVKE
jgi:sucrose-6-phosphate hydrolase SacC (GH32 family)